MYCIFSEKEERSVVIETKVVYNIGQARVALLMSLLFNMKLLQRDSGVLFKFIVRLKICCSNEILIPFYFLSFYCVTDDKW